MTDIDYDAARALCDAATPGPWRIVRRVRLPSGDFAITTGYDVADDTLADWLEYADAAFIAAARDLLPALLAEVERLTRHSVTLNGIGWRVAEALGDIPAGAEIIDGDPDSQVDRLIAERNELRAEVARLRVRDATVPAVVLLDKRTAERDEARVEIERLQRIIREHSCSPRDALDMD
jgi:hypothetical protein